MRTTENEGRDWAIIVFILLFGLFWILVAGGWALRFAPRWELNTNVESKLNPDSDFLTNKPGGFIEPVDSAILTNSWWMNAALTPGASFPTLLQSYTAVSTSDVTASAAPSQTPGTPVSTQTTALATSTAPVSNNPTNTLISVPSHPTLTAKPNPGATSTATSISTPTATATSTSTATGTATATATPTPTDTVDVSEPDYGGPDGNAIMLANGMSIEINLSGFSIDGDSAWDLVYYEKESTSAAGKIHLGAVLIEAYDQTTGTWYTVYNWGDGNADTNASYNNGNAEPDGFPVDKSQLYGTSPLNTGIAIDIDTSVIGQGGNAGDAITKIRITSLSNNDCDVDALQMLR